MRLSLRVLGVFLCVLLSSGAAFADRAIIRCARPCTAAKAAVTAAGGRVTYDYRYVNAIAVNISRDALASVSKQLPAGSVRKDLMVSLPTVARDRDRSPMLASAQAVGAAPVAAAALTGPGAHPDGYLSNNANTHVASLIAAGNTGAGMKVAVIDSGIRPGFPHISLDGSVIGGEDFVGDGLTYSNDLNNGHGTFVAGMISANVVFSFSDTSAFAKGVKLYCPSCVIVSPGTISIPMLGSAPLSSLYSLRVFPPTGGAPESTIIAAMERVITLRENFDNGMPETHDAAGKYNALNVKVCNMSLGGSTLYAGRDVEDEITQAFLDHDIVLVVAAGNAGPSGNTIGSPATGFSALTVGATNDAIHERSLRDLQLAGAFGTGIGALYRPFGGTQMAYFSSRGPDSDGRVDPDVVANGFASYGQGLSGGPTSINLGSGTSFSTPTVSGIAAVLRQAVPAATARQVRNALIMSANPNILADGSGALDQGAGYVDATAAHALLLAGAAPDTNGSEGGTATQVHVNMVQSGVKTYNGNVTRTATMRPGERFETFYRVQPNTAAVVVTLSNVQPGASQNALFGDDILFAVHTAKTSSIGEGDYQEQAFTLGETLVVPNPETGMMRITAVGDWTNKSPIQATINAFSVARPVSGNTSTAKLLEGDLAVVPFTVPAGAHSLNAYLEWSGDWGAYPTNDLDLILIPPTGPANVDAATINSPERADIANPAAGTWFALVDGFSIPLGDERYKLVLSIDGNVVH